MNWYLQVLKRYAEFSGRSRRKEFWFFALFNIIIAVGLGVVDTILAMSIGVMFLNPLYFLAVLVPTLAVSVRRLHDTGRSGWWILLGFVPVLGLVILVFMFMDSQPGDNEYGPNPKSVGEPVTGAAVPAT